MSTTFVALAALCWGLSGGIGGILMSHGWDPLVLSFHRGAIGLLLVLIWLALRPRGSGLKRCRVWFWSAVAGLGVSGNFAFYFVSIDQGSVAVASIMAMVEPVTASLFGLVVLQERLAGSQLVGMGLILVTVTALSISSRAHRSFYD